MSNATEASREEKLPEKMTESVNALNVNLASVKGKNDSALELKNDGASLMTIYNVHSWMDSLWGISKMKGN